MTRPPEPTFSLSVPDGDERPRRVCDSCGFIDYVNPKVVVGAVVVHGEGEDERILLCRRAIEPSRGRWTIPAGFLEEQETTQAGAAREAMEEALADIEVGALLAIYNIAPISQVQIMYRARLRSGSFGVGPESLETRLFAWDDIPWDDLAFPSVRWVLEHWRAVRGRAAFAPFCEPA